MFKSVVFLAAVLSTVFSFPHLDVDMDKVRDNHVTLARSLIQQSGRPSISTDGARLSLRKQRVVSATATAAVAAADNTTSDHVFGCTYDDRNCTSPLAGYIARTDTCLWGTTEFQCKNDAVVEEIFTPFGGQNCAGNPVASVKFENTCQTHSAPQIGHVNVRTQCGTPPDAVWLVPHCDNSTNPDFSLFQPADHCFGQVMYRCGADGSTNILFWQDNGCEGNPTFGQKIADAGECVQGFTLWCINNANSTSTTSIHNHNSHEQ